MLISSYGRVKQWYWWPCVECCGPVLAKWACWTSGWSSLCLAALAFHPITVWASEAGTPTCAAVTFIPAVQGMLGAWCWRMLMAALWDGWMDLQQLNREQAQEAIWSFDMLAQLWLGAKLGSETFRKGHCWAGFWPSLAPDYRSLRGMWKECCFSAFRYPSVVVDYNYFTEFEIRVSRMEKIVLTMCDSAGAFDF